MARIDDVRNTIETTLGTLTPAKAQQLAKGMLEPDARKEQVAKTVGDLLEWSQRNRQRMRDLIRREIREQLEQVGVASRADLDALKKRVRELERRAGMTASGRRGSAAASAAGAKPAKTATKTAAKSATKASSKSTARSSATTATDPSASSAAEASTVERPASRPSSTSGSSASDPAANA